MVLLPSTHRCDAVWYCGVLWSDSAEPVGGRKRGREGGGKGARYLTRAIRLSPSSAPAHTRQLFQEQVESTAMKQLAAEEEEAEEKQRQRQRQRHV